MADIFGLGIIISLIAVFVVSIPMSIIYLVTRTQLHSYLNKNHGKKYNVQHVLSTGKRVPKIPKNDPQARKLRKRMIVAEIIMALPIILFIIFAFLATNL